MLSIYLELKSFLPVSVFDSSLNSVEYDQKEPLSDGTRSPSRDIIDVTQYLSGIIIAIASPEMGFTLEEYQIIVPGGITSDLEAQVVQTFVPGINQPLEVLRQNTTEIKEMIMYYFLTV